MIEPAELDQIRKLIENTIGQSISGSMHHAAMQLEAIRVSALIAENQALKLQIIALEQQLLQLDKKLMEATHDQSH